MPTISTADAKKYGLIEFHINRKQRAAQASIPWVEMGFSLEAKQLTVFAQVRLISEANRKDHWGTKLRRKQEQGKAMMAAFFGVPKWTRFPCVVRLVRLFRKQDKPMDGDNLQRACKKVRDDVAAWLGLDDADPRIRWAYAQEPGKAVGVMIEVQEC